jgi:hypothetical protein
MSKRNYYCLVAGLPDIVPDDKKLHLASVEVEGLSAGGTSSGRF